MLKITKPFLLLFVLAYCFVSCNKEEKYVEKNISFSTPVILFDTLFVSLGSTTLSAKIFNPHTQTVLISNVRLCGGTNSRFRMNLNGDTTISINDIFFAAKDSMYVFVRININPTDATIPFIIEDSIAFTIGSSTQYLKLVAFGQNAYFHTPTHQVSLPSGEFTNGSFAGCAEPWKSDKPHVILGTCVVKDSLLKLEPGTKIYFANNACLLIDDGGSIQIKGTKSLPVLLTGIRKDLHIITDYAELAGQWKGIWFSKGSVYNEIDWAIIKNGVTAIQIDSNRLSTPFKISNTYILNMSQYGINATHAHIEAKNLLLNNCRSGVQLSSSGTYQFTQCSFLGYWGEYNSNTKSAPCISLSQNNTQNTFSALFENCIIHGSSNKELVVSVDSSASLLFRNCLVDTSGISHSYFQNCLFNTTPLYVNRPKRDFRPAEGSPVIGKGDPITLSTAPFDLDSISRLSLPSIGAYEYAPH